MRALILTAPHQFQLGNVSTRLLEDMEMRIGVSYASVCGSDLNFIRNPRHVPQVLGHEFSGKIIELGNNCNDFELGGRVTVSPIIGCLECASCKKKDYRACYHKKILGFDLRGAFADEIIINKNFVVKLPDSITDEQGALIEHLCCGFRLSLGLSKIERKSHILIIGDGPIALGDLQMLRISGLEWITLIGKHDIRKKVAIELGAARVLNSNNLTELSCLPLIDIAIIAADADQTLIDILPFMKVRSSIYVQTRITNSSSLQYITTPEISIKGTFAYEIQDFLEVIKLIEQNKINTKKLITHRSSLEEFSATINDVFIKKDKIKTIIKI